MNLLQQEAAHLLLTCFPDIFPPLFRSPQQAAYTLSNCLNLQQALLLRQQQQITALLGYAQPNRNFLNLHHPALQAPVPPEQFYIEILCTAPNYRQQGLARQLLQQAFTLAQGYQYKEIALDVVSTNRAAIQLYQQTGFIITGQHQAQTPLQHISFYRMVASVPTLPE